MRKPAFKRDVVNNPLCHLPPGRPMRVEHEYFRQGAWSYLAAWDVHRAKLFGHCEKKSGIAPTDRLIAEVMRHEPYKSAKRVFWIIDNCSAHRGQKAMERIRSRWPNPLLVHTPAHASWINQIEIYFSIVQRLPRFNGLSRAMIFALCWESYTSSGRCGLRNTSP